METGVTPVLRLGQCTLGLQAQLAAGGINVTALFATQRGGYPQSFHR